MNKLGKITAFCLALCLLTGIFSVAGADGAAGVWYCPSCGRMNTDNFCPSDGTARPVMPVTGTEPWDMGIPYIGSVVYGEGAMNMDVFWVQTQMKATGVYYQGEQWDVTGNLGDHTKSEIRDFMRARGYTTHSGNVDQNVINQLAACLGNRVEPVMVGGFYEYMNCLMSGGSAGSMQGVVSNLRDNVPRVTTEARWMQICLNYLGYYNSTIDGKFGEVTENALKRFQKDHSFEQRDYLSLGVARELMESYYYQGGDLSKLSLTGGSGGSGSIGGSGGSGSSGTTTVSGGVSVQLNQRMATRTGPGTKFTEPGSFFKAGEWVTAHTRAYDEVNEIWWIQVEFSYGGARYRAYTGAKRLNMDVSTVPTEKATGDLTSVDFCWLYAGGEKRYGPGTEYRLYPDMTNGSEQGYVICVENGWVQFQTYSGNERYWVRTEYAQY